MLGNKRKIGKCEKNVPTRLLQSHPAGGQETNLFLRVALLGELVIDVNRYHITDTIRSMMLNRYLLNLTIVVHSGISEIPN